MGMSAISWSQALHKERLGTRLIQLRLIIYAQGVIATHGRRSLSSSGYIIDVLRKRRESEHGGKVNRVAAGLPLQSRGPQVIT